MICLLLWVEEGDMIAHEGDAMIVDEGCHPYDIGVEIVC
jgi:hypothetical protein